MWEKLFNLDLAADLQVNAVTPVMDLHPKFLNKHVSEKILK